MEANAEKSFQMQIIFNIYPRISLHCKLVPVQYYEYEYGLLLRPITTGANNAMNQSEFLAITCSKLLKALEQSCVQGAIGICLLIINWKADARFLSQSPNVAVTIA